MKHYAKGGEVKTNLSPSMEKIKLSNKEIDEVVAFMNALSSPFIKVSLPELPLD